MFHKIRVPVVLGMHRSGTSALTRGLAVLGYELGDKLMSAKAGNNERGFFEDLDIYHFNQRVMKAFGSSWLDFGEITFGEQDNTELENIFFDEAITLLREKLKSYSHFAFKDPRTAVLLPFWRQVFEECCVEPCFVISVRHPDEVALSLGARDGISHTAGLLLWARYMTSVLQQTQNCRRLFVSYEGLLEDPLLQLGRIARTLECEPPVAGRDDAEISAYLSFLTPELRHQHMAADALAPESFEDVYALHRFLNECCRNVVGSESLSAPPDDLMTRLKRLLTVSANVFREQQARIDVARKDLADKEREKSQAQKQVAAIEAGLKRERENSDVLKNKLVKAQKELTDEQQRSRQLDRTVATQEQQINSAYKQLEQKKQELLHIKNSRAFKILRCIDALRTGVKTRKDTGVHLVFIGIRWVWQRLPMQESTKATIRNKIVKAINKIGRRGSASFGIRHATAVQNRRSQISAIQGFSGGNASTVDWHCRIPLLGVIAAGNLPLSEPDACTIQLARASTQDATLRVSVIIPTWNRKQSITKAIDSALGQSYQPYEIVVADDGSTDGTVFYLQEKYASEISKALIKVISCEHQGVSAARNAAMNAASGDLFAYLDSDNIWREHYLLVMCAAFAQSDELMTAYAALESHNLDSSEKRIRADRYDRKRLLTSNFIDLNVFIHRSMLYRQFGGFDTSLKRLVDWELILRYTKNYVPAFLPIIGVDYFLSSNQFNNITFSQPLEDNYKKVTTRHLTERIKYGVDQLRIAYFVYDFPALSQTFVFNELRWLVENRFDVKVYYAVKPEMAANLDFPVEAYQCSGAEELAKLFIKHKRTLCHSHFAYPGVTLYVQPACQAAGILYTFMPHAVDLFHKANRERNRIAEISNHSQCLKVFVYGEHHRKFLVSQGVDREKIAYTFQAISDQKLNVRPLRQISEGRKRGIFIARFIEKKGADYLLEAAHRLRGENVEFVLYGYGPLEKQLKHKAQQMNLSNVTFEGALVGDAALKQAYENADFFIAPYIEAETGDIDGFPTVILEAFASGLPVIATPISAVPDYLRNEIEVIFANPKDGEDLVRAVRYLLDLPKERLERLVKNAQTFLDRKVGVDSTMKSLLDTWTGYEIDIFLVTYNTQKYENSTETLQIIERIFSRTTTPFTLTIVDNGSDNSFWSDVIAKIKGRLNVRLLRLKNNVLCGPASNIALAHGSGEFSIYVCSKEGFVRSHGWERALVQFMRSNQQIPLAGYLVHLPKYTYGHEFKQHPEITKFRNGSFAQENPDRAFSHVQGGLYICRREALLKIGAFSSTLPQSNTDVELSFYLESLGYQLGSIPELVSITTKTLPRLTARLDDSVVAAHPFTAQSVSEIFDVFDDVDSCACNLCGWHGRAFECSDKLDSVCPTCGSTGFGRMAYREVAASHLAFRGVRAVSLSGDKSLANRMSGPFEVDTWASAIEMRYAIQGKRKAYSFVVIDLQLLESSNIREFSWLRDIIQTPADLVVSAPVNDTQAKIWREILDWFSIDQLSCQLFQLDRMSPAVAYDWRGGLRLSVEPFRKNHQILEGVGA